MVERSGGPPVVPARGVRLAWGSLPLEVRRTIEQQLGSRVVRASSSPEGFSPAFAGVVTDARGRRTFLKVVVPDAVDPNLDAPEIFRREIRSLSLLPSGLPTPRLLWSIDQDGWVALALEAVDGHTPHMPWRRDELDRVFAAWNEVSRRLTPAPPGFPRLRDRWEGVLRGWRTLFDRPTPAGLGKWETEHLEELAELEAGWPEAAQGTSLLHGDLRADNVLLTDDRVYFVDWPDASVGAGWVDLAFMLPSVAMQGGPAPWELWGQLPGTERVERAKIRTMVAAFAGFMVSRAREPPPPGLPTLRAFQHAQAVPALAWLRELW